jgi:pimeloyl-ACP methyl ester carboxylesterase/DNA-binding winged helix-turn-helix (wHTH) protein
LPSNEPSCLVEAQSDQKAVVRSMVGCYQFGDWRVEPDQNRICNEEVERHLEPLSMNALTYLLDHPGQTVSADRLLDFVWRGRVVEPNAVPRVLNQIRQALGDDPKNPTYIQTIRKRGYRTLAQVRPLNEVPPRQTVDGRPRNSRKKTLVLALFSLIALTAAYLYGGALISALVLNAPTAFFADPVDQELGMATSADGTKIAFAVSGDGPPLVYVLGWMTHLERGFNSPVYDNDQLLAMTSQAHRFVRYDGRGFGMSERDVDDFSLAARVSDLKAVVEAAGLERFAILAASSGGPIAIAFTSQHPEMISGLVFASTFASNSWVSDQATREYRRLLDFMEVAWNRPPVSDMFARTVLDPTGTAVEVAVLGGLLRRCCDGPNVAEYFRIAFELDVREQAKQIAVPTLVMHASGDQAVPIEAGKELASLIPRSRLLVVDGGHREGTASTAQTRQLALDFLAELP